MAFENYGQAAQPILAGVQFRHEKEQAQKERNLRALLQARELAAQAAAQVL